VVVSVWSGGFPAGLFATVLSALGHIYLLLPAGGSWLDAAPSSWYDLVLAKALRERVLELVEADRHRFTAPPERFTEPRGRFTVRSVSRVSPGGGCP